MRNTTYPRITIVFALAFIGLGVGFYFGMGGPAAEVSPTALIPAGPGGLLLLCGLAALKASWRKAFMHIAAVLAVLSALAGTRTFMKWSELEPAPRAEMLAMFALGVVLTLIYVKSFVDARRGAGAGSAGE
jgi:peptidoglycan/LPS O-acetylase OafA/YrhL